MIGMIDRVAIAIFISGLDGNVQHIDVELAKEAARAAIDTIQAHIADVLEDRSNSPAMSIGDPLGAVYYRTIADAIRTGTLETL